jgi:hypothetical protein
MQILASIFLLSHLASAIPVVDSPLAPSVPVHRRCGPVAEFYGQTAADWQTHNTDKWLFNWVKAHVWEISNHTHGFAGAFGQWALGNPDWSCRDDGSDSSCDLDLCDNRVLNSRGDDMRNAYYVLEGINRLHSYFEGLGEAFQVSSIATALSKESWSVTFYEAEEDTSKFLNNMLTAIASTIGVVAALAGLAGEGVGAAGAAFAAIANGAITIGKEEIKEA